MRAKPPDTRLAARRQPLRWDGHAVQKYLQDILRVLAVAMEVAGDEGRALFLIRNEPLRAFGYKTVDALVQEGRADAVVAYLESLTSGAAG